MWRCGGGQQRCYNMGKQWGTNYNVVVGKWVAMDGIIMWWWAAKVLQCGQTVGYKL